ncbi:MAG TPA: hypothetical protein VGI75_01220 [Pirellulales bacterium]|jgi:hypothetical protein
MSEANQNVDRIVSEVLARLRAGGGSNNLVGPTGSEAIAKSGNRGGDLMLNENVISEVTIADRLAGVERLIVPPRAVITPTARDILRDENVTIVRALKSPIGAVPPQLLLGIAGARFDAGELARSLRQQGIELQQWAGDGLPAIIDGLAKQLSAGGRAMILTDNVTAALCLANRRREIRASNAANRGDVNEVLHSVGANLLVVDALRRGKFEVQRIAEAFATAPPAECPAQWKTWLE